MNRQPITLQMSIRDLLKAYPEVVPVFLRHRMNCVGCVMAEFMTLKDAIFIYKLDEEVFLRELKQTVKISSDQKQNQKRDEGETI